MTPNARSFCAALFALVLAPEIARADSPTRDASAVGAAKTNEEEARIHFTAGVNLVRDPARPRYEEAYAEFKRAYELSGSPRILGNIGLCAMKLERDAEAIEAYARYLSDVPDLSTEEREQVERDLVVLKATIATITVETSPPGARIVDSRIIFQGEPITNVYGPITTRTELGLRRGHHVLKARFDNGREVTWETDINGGETRMFELPPAVVSPVPGSVNAPAASTKDVVPRPTPTSVYVVGGATLALGIASLITGLVAVDKRSEFDAINDGRDPARATDVRSTGEALNRVSDVLLVGTVIGAGVATYLYLTRPSAPSKRSQTENRRTGATFWTVPAIRF